MDSTKKLEILLTAKDRASKSLNGVSASIQKLARTAGKAAIAVGAVIGAAVAKFALFDGFGRALKIEDAQAKLKGLGHDLQAIETIMDSALDSVRGTAFGLDAAATIAASAVAAGIEPGKELTKYLSITADAATIAGTSLSEMGSIFNKVQTGQVAYTEEIRQLADRGIPIYQWLQKELGVTQKALRKMVAAGEVDSETYFKVINENIGGAALESGKTTRGAWANMRAAMARVGASIADEILPKMRESMAETTKWFDENSEQITTAIMGALESIQRFAASMAELGRQVFDYLKPKFEALINTIRDDLMPVIERLWKDVIEPLLPVLGTLLVGAIGLVTDVLNIQIIVYSKLNSVILAFLGVVVTVGRKIVSVAMSIWNGIRDAFNWVIEKIQQVRDWFNKLPGAVRSAATTAKSYIQALISPISTVVGWVKSLVGWFDTLRGKSNEASQSAVTAATKAHNAQVAGGAVDFGGGFAHGGSPRVGVPNVVGERGAELFIPNQPGKIVKNMDAQSMGSQQTVNIGDITINTAEAADRFFEHLNRDDKFTSMGLTGARA